MESMTVGQMLDRFKMLCGSSGYYKANVVVSANGKAMPVESISMNAAMSMGDTQPSYTFCLSVKEDKEDCVHVFAQDIETNGLSDAGYIGHVEGIGTLHEINKTKRSIEFDISEKFNTVMYKGDNCIDCLLWIKLKNVPMPQKFHVFEVELLPADYGDIIWLNETGSYGTLDGYVIAGSDQYKRVDGLYVKVKGIGATPIYTYVPSMSSITNLSNPDLQKRRNELLSTKVFAYLRDMLDKAEDKPETLSADPVEVVERTILDPDGDAICDPMYP